ncbi:nitroreductase [Sphingomonas sabuli]|uniref:Putative NAD(P)H nitroreductase n=1 Tax=Sphingomonas sabuli TaxID=2764186 RepID=A0A7G9L477_9SPHN|nr:nitroreductase [Sphingomonas sabuli]QNM83426.1 nitroreductase [Sphingomonas sabuli]
MLNDRTSPLSLLTTRRSARPRDIGGPGPTRAELETILTVAARTPDHGKLTPWRFVVIDGDRRDAFSALLRQALTDSHPQAIPARHQKEEDFAHYGGALVVLVCAPVAGHKVPVWEQELSCGAAGMNLLLGAEALGYDAGWVTGWRTYAPRVTDAFCGEGERIAGFFFIGRSGLPLEERDRPALGDVVRSWTPPDGI